jgi:hypothetical protein
MTLDSIMSEMCKRLKYGDCEVFINNKFIVKWFDGLYYISVEIKVT